MIKLLEKVDDDNKIRYIFLLPDGRKRILLIDKSLLSVIEDFDEYAKKDTEELWDRKKRLKVNNPNLSL